MCIHAYVLEAPSFLPSAVYEGSRTQMYQSLFASGSMRLLNVIVMMKLDILRRKCITSACLREEGARHVSNACQSGRMTTECECNAELRVEKYSV